MHVLIVVFNITMHCPINHTNSFIITVIKAGTPMIKIKYRHPSFTTLIEWNLNVGPLF